VSDEVKTLHFLPFFFNILGGFKGVWGTSKNRVFGGSGFLGDFWFLGGF
jgi:hypothetical protein